MIVTLTVLWKQYVTIKPVHVCVKKVLVDQDAIDVNLDGSIFRTVKLVNVPMLALPRKFAMLEMDNVRVKATTEEGNVLNVFLAITDTLTASVSQEEQ